ncbi:MAG: T9SS type A sorting domain-containing protein [Bacteroidota bacterium]
MKPTTTHSQNSWLKKLFLLLIIVSSFQITYAQITIPDPNFAAFLQTNFPAAMTGNVLDDQHPSVTGAQGMVIMMTQVGDFTGLEAFVNLQMLNISGDFSGLPQLTSLNFLTELLISDNNALITVPDLPPNLEKLTCNLCPNLTGTSVIPSSLTSAAFLQDPLLSSFPIPPFLEELYFENCSSMTSLSGIPNSLHTLYIAATPAVNSINFAATQIATLHCLNNNLTSLPALPVTLKNIDCSINQISSLAGLPATLLGLVCRNNNLTSLGALPAGLTYLDYGSNNVTSIVLPTVLTYLDCSGNSIACLPDLPSGLQMLYASGNLTTCLPNLPSTLTFSDIGFDLCNNLSVVTTTPSCSGPCNGTVTATFNSGEYNYVLSNGISGTTQVNATSLFFDSLCTLPNMLLMITPVSGGCSSTVEFDINDPSLLLNISISDVTCNGAADGSIVASAQNGASPYTYSIDGGMTFQSVGVFNNLAAGTYTVMTVDNLACTKSTVVVINSPPPLAINVNVNSQVCTGSSNGSITVNANGGTGAFMYSDDGGITFQISGLFSNLTAGSYIVVVQDANGCTASTITNITASPSPTIVVSNDVAACTGDSVSVCVISVTGGTAPFNYLWNNFIVTPCSQVTLSGTYILIVTDINGCSATDSVSVSFLPPLTASITGITLPTCGACDGIATVSAFGTAPFLYQLEDSTGNLTFTLGTVNTFCESENYIWHITDANGCVVTLPVTLGCTPVWPGDANYDGVADNIDLLAIGTGYGATGTARPNATINWQPETGISWQDTLLSTVNYKHIDCNGDGVIADDDTTAIIQNFSQVHALRPFNNAGPTDPELFFDIQIDTTNTSAQLSIPLILGTSLTPATDIYGIAFTVNYDTTLIKADSVTMDYSNCWLAAGHKLSLAVNDPANGRLYGAVTRTSHSDTTGFGTISTMGIVTVDNISARLATLISDTIIFTLNNVSLINYTGAAKNVNLVNDTIIINGNTTGIINTESDNAFHIYPNPAGESFLVRFAQELSNPEITMYSISNKKMHIDYKTTRQNALVNCSAVQNGLYIVVIKSNEGVYTEKLEIRK